MHAGRLTAPMPGRVVQLLVGAGDKVRQGQPLIVIEAMKMEQRSPRRATERSRRCVTRSAISSKRGPN